MRRALLPLPLLLLPLVPAPALADEPDVVVTAAVREADGGLSIVSRTAPSRAEGEVLAERWDDRPDVLAADVDNPVRASAVDPGRSLQWGLTRLRAEQQWPGGDGTGAVVAVVDSGVDGAHHDLAGVLLPPVDLVEPGRTTSVDPNGHGTHVAGVIAAVTGNGTGVAGLAPGARVLPVRVLEADGSGYDGTVARGIVAAVDRGASVVNLSLGGERPSSVLQTAVSYATSRGVVVVAAMGNSGPTGPVEYPAAFPGVLAVAATQRDDALAPFSSRGAHADLAAPGAGILSTLNGDRYAYMDGTSMASPFVAGAAALLVSSGVPGDQVADRLTRSAVDLGPAGHDPGYGNGMVDVAAARALGGTAPAQPAPAQPAPAQPAPAQPAPAPAPPDPAVPEPVLSARISASAPVVDAGGTVHVHARALQDGVPTAGLPVVLERSTGAAWRSVRTAATSGPEGLLGWTLRPDVGASYRVRVGSGGSPSVRIDVRQRVSTAASRTTATGGVAPSGEALVMLQRATATGWAAVARTVTAADGRYRLAVRLPAGTRVRAVVAARPGLLAGASRVVRVA